MLIDLPTAHLHLHVDGTYDDAMIAIYCNAAELGAVDYLNRYVYADAAALADAIAAVPDVFAAARVAYDAAVAAIALIANADEQEIALFAAGNVYAEARKVACMTHQGIVINDTIKAAILLTLGHLYANREDVIIGPNAITLPMGSRCLLQPYRVGMGV